MQFFFMQIIFFPLLPEYSLPELRADGCNRFSISWSFVVRLCVWRNKNNVHTIAATATNSLDLKRREKIMWKFSFILTELSFHFGRCFLEWKFIDVVGAFAAKFFLCTSYLGERVGNFWIILKILIFVYFQGVEYFW